MRVSVWVVIIAMILMMVFGFQANRCWGCTREEKASLLHLKALFSVAKRDLDSWTEDAKSDCCDGWEGVICGPNRRVFSLSFHGNDPNYYWGESALGVHFNASVLLPLQDLRHLNLSANGIVTWTEAKDSVKLSSTLTKLEVLDLSWNYLSSSIIQQLKGFHSLKNLSLSANRITGLVHLNDIDAISKNLKELNLMDNRIHSFTGEHNDSTYQSSILDNLEILDLSYNHWLNNNILPYLSLLKSLKHLRLRGNEFTGVVQVNDFETLQNPEELDLSENSIDAWEAYNVTWTEAKDSVKLSSTLTKLEVLDLSSNYLSSSIIQQLKGFHSLKNLSLSGNQITGPVHLINDIDAISKNLKELNLMGNQINGFTGEHNDSSYQSSILDNLEILDLSVNYGLNTSILPYLSLLKSLKHLRLGGNEFTGAVRVNDFEALQNLEELDLSDNFIDAWEAYNGTMNSWTSLKRLELLDLTGNRELGNNILPNISGLPSLKYLRLRDTGLTGQIELRDIMAIKNLKELDLSGNSITAFINYNETMKSPTSRTMLELLDLSWNPTLGNSILSTVRGLPSLKHLSLQYTGLTGQIELHDIEAIKSLEKLDLSMNSITGFVDYSGCGQMQKLEMLDLSGNELRTLPACWANLSSLQSLDVSGNQLTGDITLSPLIHLRSLQVLALSKNKFQIPHSFKAFANHTKLKYFTADSNHVILDESNEGVHPLAHGLQLMGLVLSNCGLITYPPILRHQYNLRYIRLSHNTLKGDFPTWLLENNLQLRALFMRNNSLAGVPRLPTFAHNHARVIDISENKVQGHIPPTAGAKLPQLRLLNMSNNEFNGDIPRSLCDIKPLLYLHLSDNQLSGGLGNLTKGCFNLRALTLSNNHFRGEFPSFCNLSFLEILDLQGNNFSGKIVSKMFNPSLVVLNLSNNSLEGPIPQDLCTMRELESLDLSHNKLNGPMPSCLWNSSRLHYVYLNDNRLSGHITHAVEGAPRLVTLDLSYNDLTSDIPAWIVNLTELNALLLRGNQFHSQIPDELCKLDYLSILDLSGNSLSGAIPPCLSNMTFSPMNGYVGYLFQDANLNSLSDWIVPASPDECHACQPHVLQDHVYFTTKGMSYDYKDRMLQLMSGIDLSCNKLTGEIPPEIGNLGNLLALNLSHNSLWGPIPATISNMKQLESLDLSHNSLNGSIPTTLVELDSLEVFKVVFNNLSGKIPFEAHFMTFDASSYEGNPFLCGPPLSVNCKTGELLPSSEPKEFEDGWMDMEIFYISFGASSTTTFAVVVLVALWINPHLGNVWFYFAKTFVLSGYYLMEDSIRRFRRVGNV